MPSDLSSGLLDGRWLFPESWQTGIPGVFLLFVVGPLGSGIPLGVLMARDLGLHPAVTALIYLLSDVLLAVIVEPELAVLRWLAQRNALFSRVGRLFSVLTRNVGLQSRGAHGPLGLTLLSFTVEPITSRAAGQAAGYGFVPGWTFAIMGDMAYFGLIMASTLWVSSIFGDDRAAIGIVLIGMWGVPAAIRWLRRRNTPSAPRAMPRDDASVYVVKSTTTKATPVRRSPVTHSGRRRRTGRGLRH